MDDWWWGRLRRPDVLRPIMLILLYLVILSGSEGSRARVRDPSLPLRMTSGCC